MKIVLGSDASGRTNHSRLEALSDEIIEVVSDGSFWFAGRLTGRLPLIEWNRVESKSRDEKLGRLLGSSLWLAGS